MNFQSQLPSPFSISQDFYNSFNQISVNTSKNKHQAFYPVSASRISIHYPIGYRASGIEHRYPASSIRYPASSIRYPASSIRYPASSIRYPASSI